MLGSGRPKTGRPKLGSERSGRDKQVNIRISASDLKKLNDICKRFGITQSDFLIMCIREKW